MRSFKVLSLGVECRDKATGLTGALTHWIMDMGGAVSYLFQPKGLDERCQPLRKIAVCDARLEMPSDGGYETVEVPFEILGSEVTDSPSGFKGMATHFIRHINGCFHVEIQPEGTVPTKGCRIEPCEFSLLQCVGPQIPVLAREERATSVARAPSPDPRPAERTYDDASCVPHR